MRFRKGSKVEVLNKKEVPSGSWWCAEIVSGNGHTYHVKYDKYSPDFGVATERVPRKAIRPCPPPVWGPRSWVPGDIGEVFESNSWKLAEVSRAVGGNFYFVRLLGFTRTFKVHQSDLRLRQSWQDNKWIVIRKDSTNCDDGKGCYQKSSYKMPQTCVKVQKGVDDKCLPTERNADFEEPHKVPSRGMKRGLLLFLPPEETFGEALKLRAVEKESRRQRQVAWNSSQLSEKVDAVAYPQNMLGEKYMHASLNIRTTGFSENNMEMGEPNADVGCFFARSLEPNDAESSASSVGSCSGSNSPLMLHSRHISCPSLDLDRHSSDAESSCVSKHGRKQSGLVRVDLKAIIHQYELHAYRSTMEAFYASGPISWEREALMTNLRLVLHISNDEHRMELRHLTSSETELLS